MQQVMIHNGKANMDLPGILNYNKKVCNMKIYEKKSLCSLGSSSNPAFHTAVHICVWEK